jgi:hypothetical protein
MIQELQIYIYTAQQDIQNDKICAQTVKRDHQDVVASLNFQIKSLQLQLEQEQQKYMHAVKKSNVLDSQLEVLLDMVGAKTFDDIIDPAWQQKQKQKQKDASINVSIDLGMRTNSTQQTNQETKDVDRGIQEANVKKHLDQISELQQHMQRLEHENLLLKQQLTSLEDFKSRSLNEYNTWKENRKLYNFQAKQLADSAWTYVCANLYTRTEEEYQALRMQREHTQKEDNVLNMNMNMNHHHHHHHDSSWHVNALSFGDQLKILTWNPQH